MSETFLTWLVFVSYDNSRETSQRDRVVLEPPMLNAIVECVRNHLERSRLSFFDRNLSDFDASNCFSFSLERIEYATMTEQVTNPATHNDYLLNNKPATDAFSYEVIHCISLIVRNWSSFSEQGFDLVMASHEPLLRFWFFLARVNDRAILQNVLYTFFHLGLYVVGTDLTSAGKEEFSSFVALLSRFIQLDPGQEREVVILSLSILAKLLANEENLIYLSKCLIDDDNKLATLAALLTNEDFNLVSVALQCIYKLSQKGVRLSTRLCKTRNLCSRLMGLILVDDKTTASDIRRRAAMTLLHLSEHSDCVPFLSTIKKDLSSFTFIFLADTRKNLQTGNPELTQVEEIEDICIQILNNISNPS